MQRQLSSGEDCRRWKSLLFRKTGLFKMISTAKAMEINLADSGTSTWTILSLMSDVFLERILILHHLPASCCKQSSQTWNKRQSYRLSEISLISNDIYISPGYSSCRQKHWPNLLTWYNIKKNSWRTFLIFLTSVSEITRFVRVFLRVTNCCAVHTAMCDIAYTDDKAQPIRMAPNQLMVTIPSTANDD